MRLVQCQQSTAILSHLPQSASWVASALIVRLTYHATSSHQRMDTAKAQRTQRRHKYGKGMWPPVALNNNSALSVFHIHALATMIVLELRRAEMLLPDIAPLRLEWAPVFCYWVFFVPSVWCYHRVLCSRIRGVVLPGCLVLPRTRVFLLPGRRFCSRASVFCSRSGV